MIEAIRVRLAQYVFTAINEADLQAQVLMALAADPPFTTNREVIAERGRYDILVTSRAPPVMRSLVLELKVKGSAAEVERQAQRYALTDGIDAVAIVTTSQRLAAQLRGGGTTLGGKPFAVLALRGF